MRVALKWLACVGTLFLIWKIFPSYVTVAQPVTDLLAAGTVLWLVNIFIKPLAQIVSVVLSLLTFGLFSFIVNALMISLTDVILPGFSISSFWICLLAALLLSVFNTAVTALTKDK